MTISFADFKKQYKYDSATQVLQQYLDIKFRYQDCIIMFRLGDFYELFYEDATIISQLLGLTLTKKVNKQESVPMCGVPFHSVDTYLSKIIDNGHKIAICEQLESPEDAKKNRGTKAVVLRDVVRVVTQGTLFEDNLINNQTPHYLAAIVCKQSQVALCYVDITTLEFNVIRLETCLLLAELAKINPKEILVSQDLSQEIRDLLASYNMQLVFQVVSYFAESKCTRSIQEYYKINSLGAIGELDSMQISSIGGILQYLELTQKLNMPKLGFPKILSADNSMMIDSAARKGLEILATNNGKIRGSLFDVINKTGTKSGSRMLYKMLASPLTCIEEITFRHNIIGIFKDSAHLNDKIRQLMKQIGDPERILGRIGMRRASPKDLLDLRNIIDTALQAKQLLANEFGFIMPYELEKVVQNITAYDNLRELIDKTIQIDLAGNTAETGYIKPSYHPRVAELAELLSDAGSIIQALRAKYAQISGIETLKITHNNILGIFIEVTNKQAAKIDPQIFVHRQTTLNNARFTTAELQELESKMTNAKSLLIALEHEIFTQVCDQVLSQLPDLIKTSNAICMLDVFTSMAYLASQYNYVKPQMTNGSDFTINHGRHPVVELSLKARLNSFVVNDCDLSNNNIWLITGPNMAGKSTFLRQNALIAILAQSGFFVPASYAKIGIIDKIFSRIGASDDLSSGQSTFMVEMVETANILAQSSDKSLIILDEVGRGTSTYDGVSIAWSILEYIDHNIKARTLFATHYHELTKLVNNSNSIKNYHVSADEIDGRLVFLHKIHPGAADKSYGINVAELAGLPEPVVKRAKQILELLENKL